MAGLDCAEVSAAAWPSLRAGIHGTITVTDAEAHAAMRELAARGPARSATAAPRPSPRCAPSPGMGHAERFVKRRG